MFATKDLPRSHVIFFVASLAILVPIGPLALMLLPDGIGDSVWLAAFLAIILMPALLAESVRASAKTVAPTSRRVVLESPLAPDAAFAKLNAAAFGRCKVRDSDPARRVLVLSSPMSGWSYGFLYPVFVRANGTGSSIEVGILPKTIQHDLTVSRWHETCAGAVAKALMA